MYEYTFTRTKVSDETILATTSAQVVRAVHHLFDGAETERLVVLALNTQNHVMGMEEVYKGNVSSALVRVGELFRFPVRLNAFSIILVHNHPSGSLTPSTDDQHLTAEVVAAGKLLDIPLLDHIIIGNWGQHASMRDQGMVMGR